MFRSPVHLRSGLKGKPVPASSDNRKLERSLSVSSVPSPTKVNNDMADRGEKAVKGFDPSLVERCVNKYLSGEDAFKTLVARLAEEVKSAVKVAVSEAMAAVAMEMEKLRDEVSSLTEKMRQLDEKLVDRTDDLEQYTRRNNVRIFGIPETDKEDTDELVIRLCQDKLELDMPVGALCRSHRVGRTPKPDADGKRLPRPIIVRFVSYRDRRLVFGAKKRLKGTGVTIREDLTSRRLEVLRAAVARHGLTNTWTQDGRILWNDAHGKRGAATRLSDLHPSTAAQDKR